MVSSDSKAHPTSGKANRQLPSNSGATKGQAPAAPIRQGTDKDTRTSEASFFIACGISKPHVRAASLAAKANETTIETELMAEGLIDPEPYYCWLASELDLPYVLNIKPEEVVRTPSMDVLLHRSEPLRLFSGEAQFTVITPEARQLHIYKSCLSEIPGMRGRFIVASAATVRKAVWEAGAVDRVKRVTYELEQDRSDASARRVMSGPQGFALGMAVYLPATGFMLWPVAAFTFLHVFLTLFFSGGILLRFCALMASAFKGNQTRTQILSSDRKLPIYTVLIALHDEAAMIPAIVSRMSALNWPKSLLDIKYVCEVDDHATISALLAQKLGPECEIIRTPDFGPRTKPKALQYALQGARGSLVVVYDAEDKPAPGQLLESWAAFRDGEPQLGCLQAPLAIANLQTNWITRLFALEYSGLFRVLIPFLARMRMPVPLGGSSNHFRRAALEAAGGWDPHNVTEDADLGLRLYAHGYRTGTLNSATVEVAPSTLEVWTRQRTRWLKGWAQTWLVAMRRPMHTIRALGLSRICGFPADDRRHARLRAGAPADVRLHRLDAGLGGKRHGFSGLGPARHPYVDRPDQHSRQLPGFCEHGMERFHGSRTNPAEAPLGAADTALLAADVGRRMAGAGTARFQCASLGENSASCSSGMGGSGRSNEQPCEKSGNGAGEGNRTLVLSLGSFCSTIELHPPAPVILGGVEQPCQAGSIRKAA
jgi:hypothetical protein